MAQFSNFLIKKSKKSSFSLPHCSISANTRVQLHKNSGYNSNINGQSFEKCFGKGITEPLTSKVMRYEVVNPCNRMVEPRVLHEGPIKLQNPIFRVLGLKRAAGHDCFLQIKFSQLRPTDAVLLNTKAGM